MSFLFPPSKQDYTALLQDTHPAAIDVYAPSDNTTNAVDDFLYPNRSSHGARIVRGFLCTYCMVFAIGMSSTDPQDPSNFAMRGLMAAMVTVIIMLASPGSVANPMLTIINYILGHPDQPVWYPAFIIGVQLSGGILGTLTVSMLRGGENNLTGFLNVPLNGISNGSFIFLELLFSFLIGYTNNFMYHRTPRGEPPLLKAPLAPHGMSLVLFLAYYIANPFGSGSTNFVVTLSPAVLTGNYGGVWQIAVAQIVGYTLSVIVYMTSVDADRRKAMFAT